MLKWINNNNKKNFWNPVRDQIGRFGLPGWVRWSSIDNHCKTYSDNTKSRKKLTLPHFMLQCHQTSSRMKYLRDDRFAVAGSKHQVLHRHGRRITGALWGALPQPGALPCPCKAGERTETTREVKSQLFLQRLKSPKARTLTKKTLMRFLAHFHLINGWCKATNEACMDTEMTDRWK